MYMVTLTNNGETFFLRGTTWAFHADRAFQYETEGAARTALDKARQFMKPAMFKLAKIVAV